ncbi:family 43 glycosylhydrolase [Pedobacter aquatilis]|uniref:family 43 glycosylhydrolase n=1 Tax=Pedobacter aquatilis TaxID=351343 RepID=UPI0025B37648|nr:family 43 glycosylhydrolase [Pedobacter aquatilis]MDN3585944.1 family 43 glycosylhydrolase [Pedobacter aquatilis]
MKKIFQLSLLISLLSLQVFSQGLKKPIIKGYFADPTVVQNKGHYFIYATIDPWGGDELAVFETEDFNSFKRHKLNWPTKALCTSSSSNDSKVWAPSVVKGIDGKFYMYVSAGSEIWAGVSSNPLGPWQNLKADNTPLIRATDFKTVHNIDSDCFIDSDGKAYLYWGSGFNWINGKCMAVKLKADMHSFDGLPQEITPPNYFEAPHMIKKDNRYFLMYSAGKAIDETYKIGYAVGESPFGPFTTGVNSPILQTIPSTRTIGPGHHTVFNFKGQDYILYHRIVPQNQEYVLRELCIDSLKFDGSGNLKKILPK